MNLLDILFLVVVASSATADQNLDTVSELQNKALDIAVEYFNQHHLPRFAFKHHQTESATNEMSGSDTILQLRFTVKQTMCRRENFNKNKCKFMPLGRKRYCHACFKFEHNRLDVPLKYVDCVPESHLTKERENQRQNACNILMMPPVEEVHHIGSYSFMRSS
ncbi:retinoic acid receptor responder protein 2 [Protopterus annectens]|uniref:retinoic acid receptor responder protein 2 n=1 Tax=Protopterus annectens TaxID=7888 RepID=UPI001CFA6F82|nr:retinoic acid receptor responder protein 2 [Protopterus annectens]